MDETIANVLRDYWSFIAVACLVFMGGVAAKRVATRVEPMYPRLVAWWRDTQDWHPVLVAFLIGLIFVSLPVPAWFPEESSRAARAFWFMLAGVFSGQVYGATKRTVGGVLRRSRERTSQVPPASGDAS